MTHWHCPRRTDYFLQVWPDGAVVYDEASGDMHALSPLAGQVLQQIFLEQQCCAQDLAQNLLGELPADEDVGRVDVLLSEFASLGFVEPCAA